jgi:predicted MFS family arabinose efflux permease
MNRLSPVSAGFVVTPSYRTYVLAVLWIAGMLSFLDRQVFSVLLQSIKNEMHLTDTELGLIGGFAISLFYATFGLLLGTMSDRFNRRNILAVCVAVWSVMTALCGAASNFATLFLARVGVGVGESGGTPASAAILADYYPPSKRGSAFAILGTAIPGGVFVGFLVGGWIDHFFGWRWAFAAVGLPGLILAVVLMMTLREPPRGHSENRKDFTSGVSFSETLTYYWSVRTYRHLTMAMALFSLGALASGVWMPAFYQRVYGMDSAVVATWLGFIYGIGGIVGSLLGGKVTDVVVKRTGDVKWYLGIPAVVMACMLPLAFVVFLSSSPYPALLILIVFVVLQHMPLGPQNAMMQSLAGLRMRAQIAAVMGFLANAIPSGLGPYIVGAASDHFTPTYGNDTLRYAILGAVLLSFGWAAIHYYLASQTLRRDLAMAKEF